MTGEIVQFTRKISNTKELVEAFKEKANAVGLSVDCPSDGIFNAEIVVVAEAPGEREVAGKSPLIGPSGSLLWTVLRSHGITRNDCYITNVSKRQLSFDRDDKKAGVSRHEMDQWVDLLRWEISSLPNARIVVLLGNYALGAFTGAQGISDWRGSVLDVSSFANRPLTAIIGYNPAYVQRVPKEELIFKLDMSRVRRVREGRWREPKINTHINPSVDDAISYLRSIHHSGNPIAYDIETMAGETACVGFAASASEAMCINFRNLRENRYTITQETAIRRSIAEVLSSTENRLIAQNNMFDSSWLWFKDRIRVAPIWMDTMLGHHCLYPQMPHSLGYMTTQYTMHPYYKDEGKEWREGGDIDTFWRYNGKDCCITWAVANSIERELCNANLADIFHNHIMRLQPHLCRMVVGGILVDRSYRDQIAEQLTEELNGKLADFTGAVREATGDSDYAINPNSPAQLSELLFSKLKLVGRGASTDEENRKRMFSHSRTSEQARTVLTKLSEYKEDAKFFSTYVSTDIDPDNRIRCTYKQTGVSRAPGRLSSSQVPWGHIDEKSGQFIPHGMNLQNQPERAHEMYIADEGYTFVYFDAEQAEARIVAFDAGIDKWKEQFERARLDGSYDAHRALASEMFRIPYDDVPSLDRIDGKPTVRFVAKRCLPAEVEVLTKVGWRSIADVAHTKTPIAAWDKGEVRFETPSDWVEYEDAELIDFDGEFYSLATSTDHRVPSYNNGKWGERVAKDLLEKRYGGTPINGIKYDGMDYNEDTARLWAACWADGSYEAAYPNSIRISVKKERKAERLRAILSKLSYKFWYSYSSEMHHFRVYGFREKALSWNMIHWSLEARLALLDELPYWDGCPNTKRVFNTKKEDMEIIQTIAHISGKRAKIFNHGTPRENEKQCYLLRITDNKLVHFSSVAVSRRVGRCKVYCPTVPSDAFLVRHKDAVCVTLNCRHGLNYRMMPDRLASTTGLPVTEAQRAYEIYHRTTPELRKWWRAKEDEARRTRMLFNAFGRRLFIQGRLDDPETLESIVAFYPQSTLGDKICKVIYQCESDPRWKSSWRMALNVHDALIALVPIPDARTAAAIMKLYAEEPITIRGETLIIPAACGIAEPSNDWEYYMEQTHTGDKPYQRRYALDDTKRRWSTIKKVKDIECARPA